MCSFVLFGRAVEQFVTTVSFDLSVRLTNKNKLEHSQLHSILACPNIPFSQHGEDQRNLFNVWSKGYIFY